MHQTTRILFFVASTLIASCASAPEPAARDTRSELISAKFNALQGPEAQCGSDYIKAHKKSLYDNCVSTGGGEGIAGGCDHVARSITDDVLERAIVTCTKTK
jgi:hypothetical protein